jgi:phosphoglycolate phosphatase-like HAD superfamily hydrolase
MDLISTIGKLYPRMREVLAQLNRQGYGIALCPNGHADCMKTVLDSQSIGGFFSAVRVPRDPQEWKVAMVRELLQSSCRGWAVVVGDRWDDIERAHQNGLPVIAAAYGYGLARELERADAVAAAPLEIPDLVAHLSSLAIR